LGDNEHLELALLLFGDDDYTTEIQVDLDGERSSVHVFGLYFAGENQKITNTITVNHNAPRCKSNLLYKGALVGQNAHTVWDGNVFISAKAVDTDTYEANRNLLLSEGTRAESTPNLEILTGEIVRAGHASATGRFDDDQLFYLMSRGIDKTAAQKLMARGFFEGILSNIALEDSERTLILDQLERKIDDRS
jgi:Fe-S cluster assembly protein SufD